MNLRILAEAELEAASAASWYEQQLPGLGEDFLDELSVAWASINHTPRRFPKLETITSDREIRRCLLTRFPYLVVYECLAEELVVLAVAHVHQRPNYWATRK